jgi:predicted nucleic acid-binding protein
VRVTIDSNILVYAVDHQAGERQRTASELLGRAAGGDCILTLQSLGEFFHVATRKMRLAARDVQVFIDDWRSVFPVCASDEQCLVSAIDTVRQHGLAFWDAMLWATARQARCRLLLTEDMHDGQTIDGVTFVNPFAPRNATLLEAALSRP